MNREPSNPSAAPDLPLGLATDLMLLPPDAHCERTADYLVIRTPSNPTFWWGNFLYFNSPPARGDRERWESAFMHHIRAMQPGSRHTAFSWAGTAPGHLEPFLDAGYVALESIVLATRAPHAYRHANHDATFRAFREEDWDLLLPLMVAERGPNHTLAGYTNYAKNRIAQWRLRSRLGMGNWYGAFLGSALASTLGLFVGTEAGTRGRRLARFQEVVTATAFRRQGLAGSLIAAASTDLLHRYDALEFVIVADQNDTAQRVYRALGFEVVDSYRGLEFGGY